MRVIVVGCGQVGAAMAYQLYKMGHQVAVVDPKEEAFDILPEDFKGRTIAGDVLTRQALHRAEVRGVDAFFALTDSDALNAVAAHLARSQYLVAKVAARNSDPRQMALQEAFGIRVIGTPRLRADNMAELLEGEGGQAGAGGEVVAAEPARRVGPMNVLIVGGEATGAQLAALLLEQKINVCVVENRREVLAQMHQELPTEAIYEDDPLDLQALEHAGIRAANVVVACRPSDAENLALCYVAERLYSPVRTIGRINNPRHAWLFNGKMYVDVALNEASILAHLIEEEMTLGDMMTLLKLRRGKYSLVEVVAPVGAKAIGMAIKDIPLTERCVIAAIFRRGETIVPRGATVIEEGDEVLAITDAVGQERLAELFGGGKAQPEELHR